MKITRAIIRRTRRQRIKHNPFVRRYAPEVCFNGVCPQGAIHVNISAMPDPNYEKTYDVFIPFEIYKGGINGKENFSVLTEVLIGHELDHPYEFDNAGHNDKESVHTPGEYFKSIKDMSTEPQPDPIYLNDYKAADEMRVYDE